MPHFGVKRRFPALEQRLQVARYCSQGLLQVVRSRDGESLKILVRFTKSLLDVLPPGNIPRHPNHADRMPVVVTMHGSHGFNPEHCSAGMNDSEFFVVVRSTLDGFANSARDAFT